MKTLRILMLALLLPAFVMTGCDKDGDDNGDAQIELPNNTEKTQTAFADDDTTGGFTFTAKSAWTATVKETSATRADGADWLRLLFDGEETYSGAAGKFTLVIELDENYSGKTRTATITIKSGNDTISITVTQDGKTETGVVPTPPEPDPDGEIGVPVAGSRLVSKIVISGGGDDEASVDFTYDSKNRLVKMASAVTMTDGGDGEPYSYNIEYTFDYSPVGTGDFKTTFTQSSEDEIINVACTFTLGDNGYPTSGTVEYRNVWEGVENERTATWTGTYNASGYLIKDGENDITWTGGNMTKYSGDGGYDDQFDFEYGSVANNPKCNLDLNWAFGTGVDTVSSSALVIGSMGKRSANMISKEILTRNYNREGHTFLYTYETDSQGFITKITVDEPGGEKSVATITYR